MITLCAIKFLLHKVLYSILHFYIFLYFSTNIIQLMKFKSCNYILIYGSVKIQSSILNLESFIEFFYAILFIFSRFVANVFSFNLNSKFGDIKSQTIPFNILILSSWYPLLQNQNYLFLTTISG